MMFAWITSDGVLTERKAARLVEPRACQAGCPPKSEPPARSSVEWFAPLADCAGTVPSR